jgi:hypothetical protein
VCVCVCVCVCVFVRLCAFVHVHLWNRAVLGFHDQEVDRYTDEVNGAMDGMDWLKDVWLGV